MRATSAGILNFELFCQKLVKINNVGKISVVNKKNPLAKHSPYFTPWDECKLFLTIDYEYLSVALMYGIDFKLCSIEQDLLSLHKSTDTT